MAQNQELILTILTQLQKDSKEQGILIAKISQNQENDKEQLKKISEAIEEIKATDIIQTEQIKEHIRRTNLLESQINKQDGDILKMSKDITEGNSARAAAEIKYNYKKFVVEKLLPIVTTLAAAAVALLEKLGVTNLL